MVHRQILLPAHKLPGPYAGDHGILPDAHGAYYVQRLRHLRKRQHILRAADLYHAERVRREHLPREKLQPLEAEGGIILKICIGFGPYEGNCENPAGTPWTPHWCDRCDRLRRDTITKQLETIKAKFVLREDQPC
jgi:hypothetical protein